MRYENRLGLVFCALFFVSFGVSGCDSAGGASIGEASFKHIYFFGDALTNPIDPATGDIATDEFSGDPIVNGRDCGQAKPCNVWSHYVARDNIPLAPKINNFALPYFESNGFVYPLEAQYLSDQIQRFKAFLSSLPVGPESPPRPDLARALFAIWIGNVDVNQFQFGANNQVHAVPDKIDAAVAKVVAGVQQLAQMGGRHFLVLTVPDLGRLLDFYYYRNEEFFKDAVLAALTENGQHFRQALAGGLASLREHLLAQNPPLTIYTYEYDTFGLTEDAFAAPENYGFKLHDLGPHFPPMDDPDFPIHPLATPCSESVLKCRENPDEFIMWDHLNPTTAVHRVLATEVERLIPDLVLRVTGEPPTLEAFGKTWQAGSEANFQLAVRAKDPDGGQVQVSAEFTGAVKPSPQGRHNFMWYPGSGYGFFSWFPAAVDVGKTFTVRFTATDDQGNRMPVIVRLRVFR